MTSAAFVVHGIFVDFGEPFDTNKEGFFRLGTGTFGLFTVDFMEHGFELFFEGLVFGALIEFTDKMPADFQRVMGEIEGGAAQVLETLA